MSKVMSNGNGYVKFPINEPAEGKKKARWRNTSIFITGKVYNTSLLPPAILSKPSRHYKSRGVEFLKVPGSYYDDVLDRVGHIDEDLAPLKELGILVDRDDEGYLLQIFTRTCRGSSYLCFLRSYKGKEPGVLAKAISGLCLKP